MKTTTEKVSRKYSHDEPPPLLDDLDYEDIYGFARWDVAADMTDNDEDFKPFIKNIIVLNFIEDCFNNSVEDLDIYFNSISNLVPFMNWSYNKRRIYYIRNDPQLICVGEYYQDLNNIDLSEFYDLLISNINGFKFVAHTLQKIKFETFQTLAKHISNSLVYIKEDLSLINDIYNNTNILENLQDIAKVSICIKIIRSDYTFLFDNIQKINDYINQNFNNNPIELVDIIKTLMHYNIIDENFNICANTFDSNLKIYKDIYDYLNFKENENKEEIELIDDILKQENKELLNKIKIDFANRAHDIKKIARDHVATGCKYRINEDCGFYVEEFENEFFYIPPSPGTITTLGRRIDDGADFRTVEPGEKMMYSHFEDWIKMAEVSEVPRWFLVDKIDKEKFYKYRDSHKPGKSKYSIILIEIDINTYHPVLLFHESPSRVKFDDIANNLRFHSLDNKEIHEKIINQKKNIKLLKYKFYNYLIEHMKKVYSGAPNTYFIPSEIIKLDYFNYNTQLDRFISLQKHDNNYKNYKLTDWITFFNDTLASNKYDFEHFNETDNITRADVIKMANLYIYNYNITIKTMKSKHLNIQRYNLEYHNLLKSTL